MYNDDLKQKSGSMTSGFSILMTDFLLHIFYNDS